MKANDSTLLELLYSALNNEFGIVIATSDPVALKQRLYKLRKEDEALLSLSLTTSPTNPETEIWIIKNGQEKTNDELS